MGPSGMLLSRFSVDPLWILYLVENESDVSQARTGNVSALHTSLIGRQRCMEVTGEDGKWRSVWKWEAHPHAHVRSIPWKMRGGGRRSQAHLHK